MASVIRRIRRSMWKRRGGPWAAWRIGPRHFRRRKDRTKELFKQFFERPAIFRDIEAFGAAADPRFYAGDPPPKRASLFSRFVGLFRPKQRKGSA